MSNFKPIETQEELDAIIGERISKAKRKAAEEYSDYEDIKARNADYEKQIVALTNELKEKDEKISEHDAIVADLNSKVQSYATAAVKTKVAHDCGLPYEFAERLTGDDEEALIADAKKLAKFITQPAPPLGALEPNEKDMDPQKSAMLEMVRTLNKEI